MLDPKVDVVAIISPKEGKVDYFLGLLGQLAQSIQDNEPTALRYQIHKEVNSQDGCEDIVVIEQYESMAACEQHLTTKGVLDLLRRAKEEDLLAKPIVHKVIQPVLGFASRL